MRTPFVGITELIAALRLFVCRVDPGIQEPIDQSREGHPATRNSARGGEPKPKEMKTIDAAEAIRSVAMHIFSGPLLLGPRIGEILGEASDRESRRRRAVDNRRNDAW